MFEIDAASPMPLYAQLEQAIRLAIATGRLRIGDQLPTVRQLAVDLRINANTVARVYSELERAGVLETRRGTGTFVRANPNAWAETSASSIGIPPMTSTSESASATAARSNAREIEREKRLAGYCGRFLAEAAALGFAPREAIQRLSDFAEAMAKDRAGDSPKRKPKA